MVRKVLLIIYRGIKLQFDATFLFLHHKKTTIMFGDLFGQMEEQQKALREKLRTISVEAEAGDEAIKITANAAREITNITIDPAIIDPDDAEQLEDLLLVAINRVLEKAATKESAESQKLINDMLPGMDGLFGG